MDNQTKSILKRSLISGIVSGVIYAGLNAGFDYSEGLNFRVGRFLFNFLFFGTFMVLMNRYILRKQAKKEKNNQK